MKTKELLSLPVGKYICTDEICNYVYLLEVKSIMGHIYYNLSEGLDEFSKSYHGLYRSWYDNNDKNKGQTWKCRTVIGGLISWEGNGFDIAAEIQFIGKFTMKEQGINLIKDYLIERICNIPNSDFRKRFLQDKLKQIIKNAK